MKNSKYILLLLPVAMVVIASGCVGGGSGPTTGPGVAILNFEPDFSSVESGDEIRLYLQIQNQGEEQANNVKALLTGIDAVELNVDSVLKDFDYMIPPNTDYGTEGEIQQHYYRLTAPVMSQGQEITYNPKIRVYYDYETNANKQITLVNSNELRRLIQEGKSLPTGDTSYSAGPLSVNVATGKYIKARTEGGYYFPITITINNAGNGVVSKYQSNPTAEPIDYKVEMQLDLPGSGLSIDGCSADLAGVNTYGVELWKGSSATITCRFNIINVPNTDEQKTLNIKLKYSYYIDSSASFTVKGFDF
ncbi:MAG: hypothetical protein ABIF08_00170 [Nanoarchaeota archaeon]